MSFNDCEVDSALELFSTVGREQISCTSFFICLEFSYIIREEQMKFDFKLQVTWFEPFVNKSLTGKVCTVRVKNPWLRISRVGILGVLRNPVVFLIKSLRLQHTTHCFPITLACVAARSQPRIFLRGQHNKLSILRKSLPVYFSILFLAWKYSIEIHLSWFLLELHCSCFSDFRHTRDLSRLSLLILDFS